MIRAPFKPLHPRHVKRSTLLRFGNDKTIRGWYDKGEVSYLPSVAIQIAYYYGQRDFHFRVERMKPEEIRFPVNIPLSEIARSLGVSHGMPSAWRTKGAGPVNGAVQLLDVIQRTPWLDDLRATYKSRSIDRAKLPASDYTREELTAIGGDSRVGNWIHQGQIAPNFSAIIRIAEEQGLDLVTLDLPEEELPGDVVRRITYGIPGQAIAELMGVSFQTVSKMRNKSASPMFGLAQLLTMLHRFGYFDRLRTLHGVTETAEEFDLVMAKARREESAEEPERYEFFYGPPRFARLHDGRRIGPVYPTEEEAAKCTSTDTRLINRRNVRTLDGERYIYIDGETVALIEEEQ